MEVAENLGQLERERQMSQRNVMSDAEKYEVYPEWQFIKQCLSVGQRKIFTLRLLVKLSNSSIEFGCETICTRR